jgi:hypothetical protein
VLLIKNGDGFDMGKIQLNKEIEMQFHLEKQTNTKRISRWFAKFMLRQTQNNPRVIKKPVSKFRSKKVKHRGTGTITNPPVFVVSSTA